MEIQKLKPTFYFAGTIVLFAILSFVYFSPVLKGYELPQMDNIHAIGMSQELVEHEEATGEHSFWTNSMFGGMPAYQIKGDSSANIFSYINRIVRFGLPYSTVAILFLYLLGFYVLLRSMKMGKLLSLLGAIAFAFGSYNIIIIIAGHITKAYAIAMMAPVIAGILYTLNSNKWKGAFFTAFTLGLHIAYNHVQITYYLFILVLVLMLSRFIYAWKDGQIRDFLIRAAILVGAALLAVLPNLPHLLPTYEYGKFSIRGPSELESSTKEGEQDAGLDRDYAFDWSYGKAETLTLLIPNVMGGASEPLSKDPRAMEEVDNRLREIVGGQSQYWGSKPFTSGPVYVGALICFFFVLSLFFYKGREKWWLVAATILSIILAWGKNLEWFNYFMFDHFPLYNKFRTVEMTLVVATVTIPLLGMIGLKKVVDNPAYIREQSSKFLAAFGLTGGVALILYLFPDLFFNFMSREEVTALAQQKQDMPDQAILIDQVIMNMKQARMALLKTDALRSFFFILLGSGSLWLYATNRVSKKYILPGLVLLVLIDLWGVDKRYLNSDDFEAPRQISSRFEETKADAFILEDDDTNFRVFTIYRNPFTEVNTSYFHKSIGGYHGAKLRIYQDIIDYYLQNNWQMLMGHFRNGGSREEALDLLDGMPVLNMLNTKYVVYHPGQEPVKNIHNYGDAWFVNNFKVVLSAEEEISGLRNVDLQKTALIRQDRLDDSWKSYQNDREGGNIELITYAPDRLTYKVTSPGKKVAVFSEIYYPAGWNAYIDGEKTEIKRVNYILRALMVPDGEHTVEFRFEPSSVRLANTLAIFGGILILLFAAFLLWKYKPDWLRKS
ncbi:YfhO family protein [Anaerophaga thermohalophila]|uniref:YfhO family protein n=1 Tax=Anaerophaga thermohalophila TaxID=177400 RepID=UPI0003808B75|nr:YfhO family protein [Anaerophaga thermohalophila]